MTSKNISISFLDKIKKNPRAFFLALETLICDEDPNHFIELGITAEDVAHTIDQIQNMKSEPAESLMKLIQTIAGSNISAVEQSLIEKALSRQQDILGSYSDRLADFSDWGQTYSVLKSPGAQIWLTSVCSKLNTSEVWTYISENPELTETLTHNPYIFLDQAIKNDIGMRDYSPNDATQIPIDLLLAFTDRVFEGNDDFKETSMAVVSDLAHQFQTLKHKNPHINKAITTFTNHTLRYWIERPDLDSSFNYLGSLLFCAQDNPEALNIIARKADDIYLYPRKGPLHYFLFAPDGHGGINLPCQDNLPLPRFTLADYILAFSHQPVLQLQNKNMIGSTYSLVFDQLAKEMNQLSLDLKPLKRGTPNALYSYHVAQHRLETSTGDRREVILATMEALDLDLSTKNCLVDSENQPLKSSAPRI